MTLIVNIFGGPGVSKSTQAAGTFYHLKSQHYNVEMIIEYAKEKIFEDSLSLLSNQLFIFANQHQRVNRCLGKVEAIITDSPINLGLIYGNMYGHHLSKPLEELIRHEFLQNENLNIVLERTGEYEQRGRIQTHEEAIIVDQKVLDILNQDNIPYVCLPVNELTHLQITEMVKERINRSRV